MVTFHPPALRRNSGDNERRATWLELFYDLVFVIAVAQVSSRFDHDQTFRSMLHDIFIFLPVWWGWVGFVIYSNRFDTDDLTYRVLTLLQMFGALAMALTLHGALEGSAHAFALSYIFVRVILLISYARAWWYVPEARKVTSFYLLGFGTGVALWIASEFLSAPAEFWLWFAGLGLDFVLPWIAVRLLSKTPIDSKHLPERFGLFTIILLGEQMLAIARSIVGEHWTEPIIVAGIAAFVIAACTWWIYFVYLEFWQQSLCMNGGQPFIYGHLPLAVGLLICSVAVEHAIPEAAEHLSSFTTYFMVGGMALWLSAIALLDVTTTHSRQSNLFPWPPLVAALLMIVLALVGHLTSSMTLAAIAVILLASIVMEEWRLHAVGSHS